MAAVALNAALYVAAGILFYSVLPLSFGPVRFWPQVVIPGVFAAVFGPWVGGLGAAVGIFVNDIVLNGNPLLSLMAGVTSNFAGFWLIGYIANKKIHWRTPTLAYGLVTALLMAIAYIYTDAFYVATIAAVYIVFVAVVIASSKWRSYEAGSVIGLLTGSAIIGAMVPLFGAFFTPPGGVPLAPFTLAGGLALFIWTFCSEILFLLLLGPPIIEAIRRAFPKLGAKEEQLP